MIKSNFDKLFKKIEDNSNKIRELIKQKEPDCESIYLPNPIPKSRVKYIFIGMEPSFGHWARDEKMATVEMGNAIKNGFRNFLYSIEDFCFIYSVSNFLSKSYYITDISKIAMRVKNADKLREEVYPQFIDLLKEEINEIGLPEAKIFFIGGTVEKHLSDIDFGCEKAGTILHYAQTAARHREKIPNLYPQEYEQFSRQLNDTDIFLLAEQILKENNVGVKTSNKILEKFDEHFLTESRKKLIFTYKKTLNL